MRQLRNIESCVRQGSRHGPMKLVSSMVTDGPIPILYSMEMDGLIKLVLLVYIKFMDGAISSESFRQWAKGRISFIQMGRASEVYNLNRWAEGRISFRQMGRTSEVYNVDRWAHV